MLYFIHDNASCATRVDFWLLVYNLEYSAATPHITLYIFYIRTDDGGAVIIYYYQDSALKSKVHTDKRAVPHVRAFSVCVSLRGLCRRLRSYTVLIAIFYYYFLGLQVCSSLYTAAQAVPPVCPFGCPCIT